MHYVEAFWVHLFTTLPQLITYVKVDTGIKKPLGEFNKLDTFNYYTWLFTLLYFL